MPGGELVTAVAIKTGASLEAIQSHYDLSNQFYGLWLDEEMVYSGAFYAQDDDTLERAQVNKLDYHIAQAGVRPGSRVLEIGCGWGACLRRLVQHAGASSATGLTLSQAQVDYIRARPTPGVRAFVENWQDHRPEQPYDAIISIGAFEHFGKLEESDAEKVSAYRNFFKRCQEDFLQPGGRLSLQTFAYGSTREREQARRESATAFLAAEIFRETDPPTLANIAEAARSHFEICSLRNDRLHYAKTLRNWLSRLKARRGEAVAMVGEEAVVRYERYLQYSFIGFQTGNLDLYRVTLQRLAPRVQRAVQNPAA
jgi:cyclopropane-fatty-acyl-phospholipid synthase